LNGFSATIGAEFSDQKQKFLALSITFQKLILFKKTDLVRNLILPVRERKRKKPLGEYQSTGGLDKCSIPGNTSPPTESVVALAYTRKCDLTVWFFKDPGELPQIGGIHGNSKARSEHRY
jgi:hypothetical protein